MSLQDFGEVRTPRHAPPSNEAYLHDVRDECRRVLYGYWHAHHEPLNIHTGERLVRGRIWDKLAWGEWPHKETPNHDTIARRFNELADPRLPWEKELPGPPYVQPAIGLGRAFYVPNPLRFDMASDEVERIKGVIDKHKETSGAK